jgi:putative membrane protein
MCDPGKKLKLKTMKISTLDFALAGLVISLASFTTISWDSKSNARIVHRKVKTLEDDAFVQKAADGGLLEVKVAELVVKTTKNSEIKSFAELMLKDHSKANTELQSAAKKKGIEAPSKLSEQSEQKVQALSSKSGIEFDKAYAAAMVEDHKATVALFKEESTNGKDADFKKWAHSKLPVLEHHLSMAVEMDAKVRK